MQKVSIMVPNFYACEALATDESPQLISSFPATGRCPQAAQTRNQEGAGQGREKSNRCRDFRISTQGPSAVRVKGAKQSFM